MADGLLDNVNLVRNMTRYRGAWTQLLAGDPNWYSILGIEGYYEGPANPAQPGVHQHTTAANVGPAQAEYNDVLRLVRQYAGMMPSLAAGSPVDTSSILMNLLIFGLMGYGAWAVYKYATAPQGKYSLRPRFAR